MTTPAPMEALGPLVVRTHPIDDPGELIELLPTTPDALAWLNGGDGMVAWGAAVTFDTAGPHRFAQAQEWWQEIIASAVVRDEVGKRGTGLIAFGTFTFAGEPGSTLVVPEVVVGRKDGACWLTTIRPALNRDTPLVSTPINEPTAVSFEDGAVDSQKWQGIVASAIARIQAGQLDKVVLARTVEAQLDTALDVRAPISKLATEYRSCWTFLVDGFFGSTPEMLVRLDGGLVTSRVLAGTIRRTGDAERDLALAGTLAHSSKDLEEHEYAVRSVADALASHCTAMNVPEVPFVLHLPNVMHLATDVTGVLRDRSGLLSLVESLHPSAAVGGTPTSDALALIAEIEGFERGRYAGPVGWISASGDGEWGIGLRSGQVLDSGDRVRLYAGCGIVANSLPSDELAESEAKLVPVRTALTPRQ